MHKIRYFVGQSWLLITASLCFGLLLAATDYALGPAIARQELKKLNDRAGAMLPEGVQFEEITERIVIESRRGKESEISGYKATLDGECAGWVFNVSGPGFMDIIKLVVVVDKDFETLAGYDVLASNETVGFGDQIKDDGFRNQFQGAPAGELKLISTGSREKIDSEIVAITGATISSEAVVEIINESMAQIREQMQKKGLVGGGESK